MSDLKVGDIVYYAYVPQNPGKVKSLSSHISWDKEERNAMVTVEWLKPRLMNGSAVRSNIEDPNHQKISQHHYSYLKKMDKLVSDLKRKTRGHENRIKEAEAL